MPKVAFWVCKFSLNPSRPSLNVLKTDQEVPNPDLNDFKNFLNSPYILHLPVSYGVCFFQNYD